ncbi:hypothetical protein N7536_010382 [Penicillium majusculum]|uniref:Uncharacterized protein n=1 Tax=Penicillium solitum TaxID=60172 RepID=A0A1V6RDU6_9EURO|nr:uncharacterized protein PENSOL_c006G03040 [Penicillium solitum]KAJ5687763.1 hypothetical protein N7536_010382 [Penicillium majusculum]OQD99441.1 hypothetical protein PENSOL_c006G03040 [Penicillium solitum]
MIRDGVKNTAAEAPASALADTLAGAAKARLAEDKGEEYGQLPFAPDDPKTVPKAFPALYKEAADYYRTPQGSHCRLTNRFPLRSTDLLANFDAFALNRFISHRPLLMISGTDADTSEGSIQRLGGSDGAPTAPRSITCDSAAAVLIDGGPGGGLCLECLDAYIQE